MQDIEEDYTNLLRILTTIETFIVTIQRHCGLAMTILKVTFYLEIKRYEINYPKSNTA